MLGLSNSVFDIFICSSFVCHYTSQIGEFVVLLYIFPFSCTLACCVLFTFSSFAFCMFIFKPVFSASCVNLLDFFCICLCVCDSRHMSSAKSRSSNCLVNVQWMPFWLCLTVSLIIQSITMIKINGDRMHPSYTSLYFKCLRQFSIMDNLAGEVFVHLLDCWYSIVMDASASR